MSEIMKFEYEELEKFLIQKLKKFKYGELKKFCDTNNLQYVEVSRLRNGKTDNQRPYFLADILKALGYKKVTITHKVIFEIE